MYCKFKGFLEINVKGNTGFCNQSRMKFLFNNEQELILPYDSWDLDQILQDSNLAELYCIVLAIPSGQFLIFPEKIWATDDCYRFEGQCQWAGQYAGLVGGMSGYAGFGPLDQYVRVHNGTFLTPKEQEEGILIKEYLTRKKLFCNLFPGITEEFYNNQIRQEEFRRLLEFVVENVKTQEFIDLLQNMADKIRTGINRYKRPSYRKILQRLLEIIQEESQVIEEDLKEIASNLKN